MGVIKPPPFEVRAAKAILDTLAAAHKPRAWPDALALALLQLFTGKWPAGRSLPKKPGVSNDAWERVGLKGSTKTVFRAAYTVVGEILTYQVQASGKATQGSKVHIFCCDLANLRGGAELALQNGQFALMVNTNHSITLPGTLNLKCAIYILAESGIVPLPPPTCWDSTAHEAAIQSGSAMVTSATDRYKRLVQAGLGIEYLADDSVKTNAVRSVSAFRFKAKKLGLLDGKVEDSYEDLKSLWENLASEDEGGTMGDDADPPAKTGGRAPGRPGGFKTFDEFWNTPWVTKMFGRSATRSYDLIDDWENPFGEWFQNEFEADDAEADLKNAKRGLLLDTGQLSLARLLILRAFELYPSITTKQALGILESRYVRKEFPAALRASRKQPAEVILAGLHAQIQKDEQTLLNAKSIHENIFDKLTKAGVLTEAHRILLTALDWCNKDKASGALKAAANCGVVQNAITTLRDTHPAIQDNAQALGHLLLEALKRYQQATGKRLGKPQAFSEFLQAAKHLSSYRFALTAEEAEFLDRVPTEIDGLNNEIELRQATRGIERAVQFGFEGLRQVLGKEFNFEQAVADRDPLRAIVDDGPDELTAEDIAWAFATAERYPRKEGEDLRAWLDRLSGPSEDAAE